MKKTPTKIENCPITEAIFEIRFTSVFPPDAVFGIFFQNISKVFADADIIKLPILQLPEAVRLADPNLTYQAHHRFKKENYLISLGPRVLTFSIQKPYSGWDKWNPFIQKVLKQLTDNKVFKSVERTGLRYVNVFDLEMFSIANIKINLNDKYLDSQSTTLRTEIQDEEYLKIVQISNNVNINQNNDNLIGSILDIDIINKIKLDNDGFDNKMDRILDKSHNLEKELFFNILKDDFIISLNPKYEEENE